MERFEFIHSTSVVDAQQQEERFRDLQLTLAVQAMVEKFPQLKGSIPYILEPIRKAR